MATLQEQIDFLIKVGGQIETEIFAKAIEIGINELYKDLLTRQYLSGEIEREILVEKLGPEVVDEFDYATSCIDRDIAWGMRDEFKDHVQTLISELQNQGN